jgi:hypothetical protein
MAMFADVASGNVAPTMIKQCGQLRPDLVIYEGMDTGAGVAASVLGIPAAAYATALASFLYSPLHRSTVSYQRGMWLERDRTPPDEATLLAAALINPAPPGVRQIDGIAARTIPIRSVAYNESSATVPAWLSGPHARPRIYLTLGTVSIGAVDILSRAIAEIAPLGVDILVTVGPEGEPPPSAMCPTTYMSSGSWLSPQCSPWSISWCITAVPERSWRRSRWACRNSCCRKEQISSSTHRS